MSQQMDDPGSARKLRRLEGFVRADLAFQTVVALCRRIEPVQGLNENYLEWPALAAGLAVTYAKPFFQCDGVSKLPESYGLFPSGNPHAEVHRLLMDGRNWVYAHTDLTNS